MKKSILLLSMVIFFSAIAFTGCNSPAQKVANAQDDVKDAQDGVKDAKDDLRKAEDEYLADIESYRRENADRIWANNQSLAEFKLRIKDERKEARADYEKQIIVLEQKNTDAQRRLDEYKANGKDNWQTFKTEFNRDMDELGKALKNLTVKNSK